MDSAKEPLDPCCIQKNGRRGSEGDIGAEFHEPPPHRFQCAQIVGGCDGKMRQAEATAFGFGQGHAGLNIGQFIGSCMHDDLPIAGGLHQHKRFMP